MDNWKKEWRAGGQIAGKRHGSGVPSLLDVRSHFQGTFRPRDTRIFQARSMHSCAHHCSLPSPHPVLGGTRMRSSRTIQRNHLWSVRRLERRKRFHATNCHVSGIGPFPHEELPLFQYLSSHVARTWGASTSPTFITVKLLMAHSVHLSEPSPWFTDVHLINLKALTC